MAEFGNKATGFDSPVALPRDEAQRREWQLTNKAWWQSSPMRYDWNDAIPFEIGSREYFNEIDRRFFASARGYLPWSEQPFDKIIPYEQLRGKDVLEIGVGQGTHAQLIAPAAKSFTGIDLTEFAANMTTRRVKAFGIAATIRQMDAEEMDFPDASFDYIWSWGVIHHSADTRRVLREMHRVLRPNGRCAVMVYHRSWWNYFVLYGFLKGVVQGKLTKLKTLHHVSQTATDGAIARYYKPVEWRRTVEGLFAIESIRIYGQKSEIIPLPYGPAKRVIESLVPDAAARFFTNTMRMGSFLFAQMRKQ